MIHKFSRLLMTLVALFAMTAGARADWTGVTYTATATENLDAITVNDDATLTINADVTVTVTGGITISEGKTLTVVGPGTLVVTGAKGTDGVYGEYDGGTGGTGGVAISGNIIVQGGATVTATGGTGGNGGNSAFSGGTGGNGGNAFAGTLTYKSGTVTANGGSGGSGGWGVEVEGYGSSGSAGNAFANDVDFTQTTVEYTLTDGTSTIGSVLDQTKVVIAGGTAEPQSYKAKVFNLPASWASDKTNISAADMPEGFVQITLDEAKALAVPDGTIALIYGFNGEKVKVIVYNKNSGTYDYDSESKSSREDIKFLQTYYNAKVCYTVIAPAIEVLPGSSANTWTFDMPASDVVLTPIYAPVAQWATESDVKLLPTAAEGIFAGTTDPIIVEGTVAPGQGTVMYAVTSTNQATAPELSAFSATVPTAENIADEGADVLVWYYIQGAATPDGQEATAENTFNDSEICATPLEVSVLSNQFDITFNAASANTIEGGKATVTVGGTPATVTEGKLEGVKMGSEVKMTAKQGYKFRKVEAKKAGPALKTLTVKGMQLKYVEGDTWQQAIERPENEGSGWRVQNNYIYKGGYTLFINEGTYVYVRPGDTIDATKNYSLEAD